MRDDPRVLHSRTTRLVAQADRLYDFMDIHQRNGILRMLKVRIHVVRRSAGEALDVRKIDDGFVKLKDRAREQRNNPSVVIAGVASGRGGRPNL